MILVAFHPAGLSGQMFIRGSPAWGKTRSTCDCLRFHRRILPCGDVPGSGDVTGDGFAPPDSLHGHRPRVQRLPSRLGVHMPTIAREVGLGYVVDSRSSMDWARRGRRDAETMSGQDRSFRVCICLLASAFLLGVSGKGMAALGPHGEKETAQGMSISQAMALGVVEGVTEFLPISSTGHLLLAQRAMGIGGGNERSSPSQRHDPKEASDAYVICIQGGAILAILFL